MTELDRREFLCAGLATAGVMLVVPCFAAARPGKGNWAPNQWLAIDASGTVTLQLHKSEMGQGVRTALPMLVAEELGVDWRSIRLQCPQPSDAFDMGTAGSSSIAEGWESHRGAAAAARAMMIEAAARKWRVPPLECDTRDGRVLHLKSRRSAAFGALVAAARALPIPSKPPLRERGSYRLLGTRASDATTPDVVTGAQRFGIDVRRPGMLYASIERPPAPGALLLRIDDTETRKLPGVSDVRHIASGVAVVARDSWSALRGRDRLRVEWSRGAEPQFDNEDGWNRLARALQQGGKRARHAGDVPQALASAERRFSAEYRWTWQAHAAIEPLNCVAHVTRDRCEVWVGTQNANRIQRSLALALNRAPDQIVIHSERLGGGFGRRIADDFVIEAALLARELKAPVQVLWTRADDLQHDFYNPAQINRIEAGIDRNGRIRAWAHDVADFHLTMFGDYNANYDPAADGDPWGGFDAPYEFENIDVRLALVPAPVPTGAWRSVSYPAAVLARECALDEIAHLVRQDPLALRLSLIPSPGNVQRGNSFRPNGDRLRRVVEEAAARAGWGSPVPASAPGRRAGRGFACNAYHQGTMVAQVAEVEVDDAGRIHVRRIVSAVECGQVINRAGVEKQFEGGVAWALSALLGPGVAFGQGATRSSSFADYPILTMADMPRVETHVLDSDHRPFGIGEPPVPAVAPAVLNAVHAATGVRLRTLPLDAADALRRRT